MATNNIPKHWQVKKLSEIGKSVTGTTPPKNDTTNYGNDIPFVKPPQLFDSVITNAPEKLSTKGASFARILPENSVLITCIGNLGRTAINKVPVAFNQQINAVIPSKEINGKFLFYQAQSHSFKSQLDELSSATTVAIVNKGKFETIRIVLPPLSEQLVIVSKIEELLSDLENGKQQLLTAQQQLKVYRQSLLKAAFEGKLTSTSLSKQKEGELPKGWKWLTINDIGKIKGGKRLPPKHQYSEEPTDYIYIMAGNLKDGTVKNKSTYIKEETYNVLTNYIVTGGEVYITIVGACIGDAGVIPENISKSILTENAAKIIDLKDIHNKFLSLWINSVHCQTQIKSKILSATLGKLALNRIGTLEVPLAPISEQNQIVEILESKLTVCDKIEETISQSLLQAETLKQSILKKAFEGKLIK